MVHLVFLGFLFFLKFLWHFDLQKRNTCISVSGTRVRVRTRTHLCVIPHEHYPVAGIDRRFTEPARKHPHDAHVQQHPSAAAGEHNDQHKEMSTPRPSTFKHHHRTRSYRFLPDFLFFPSSHIRYFSKSGCESFFLQSKYNAPRYWAMYKHDDIASQTEYHVH